MMTQELTIGTRLSLNGFDYEITEVRQDVFRLSGLNSKKEKPLHRDQVTALIANDSLKLHYDASDNWSSLLLHDSKTRLTQHRKYFYCSEAYRTFGPSIPRSSCSEFVLEYSKKYGDQNPPSERTLRRWFKKFIKGYAAPSSLLRKLDGTQTRSRQLDEKVVELIDYILHSEYLGDDRMSLRYAYDLFNFELLKENKKRQPLDLPNLEMPSYETFRREKNKIPPKHLVEKRLGKYAAKRTFKYGGKIRQPSRIGERVESDSNYMDILIVNTQMEVIGRPYLCAIMDVFTRCIIGWEISFCPPSAAKTLRALRHAITTESSSEFKCVMDELIIDNGPEFVNESLEVVAQSFNITLRYVAPMSPDEKPFIERFFRTMNERLIHLLPGTTFSNIRHKGDYPSEQKAVLTIDQLREYFREWLENVYHKSTHRMINCTPKNYWEKNAIEWQPITCAKEEVDKLCRRVVKRSLKGGRVRFDNLFWHGPSLAVFQNQLKPKQKVNVFIDETDLGSVWVQSPIDSNEIVQADALDPKLQDGLSMYEYGLIQKELSSIEPNEQSLYQKLEAQAALRKKIKLEGKKGRKKKARIEADAKKSGSKKIHSETITTTSKNDSDHFNNKRTPEPDLTDDDLEFEIMGVEQ